MKRKKKSLRCEKQSEQKNNALKLYDFLLELGCRSGCHQKVDRSFFFRGYQFPVCARCTGVLIGYLLTLPLFLVWNFGYIDCLGACVVMLFDWSLQYFGFAESTNFRRLITGVFGGFGVFGLQLLFLWELVKQMKYMLSAQNITI